MGQKQTMEQEQSIPVAGVAGPGVSSDKLPIYEALRRGGADEPLAYAATQRIGDLAGLNVVTILDARIEAQGVELGARIEAQGAELRAEIKAQDAKLSGRIEAQGAELRAEIKAQGAELGARIDALAAEIESQRAVLAAHTTSLRWVLGILLSVFAALIVLLAQALREPSSARAGGTEPQTVEVPAGNNAPVAEDLVTEKTQSVDP